jgi:hypothetical protein
VGVLLCVDCLLDSRAVRRAIIRREHKVSIRHERLACCQCNAAASAFKRSDHGNATILIGLGYKQLTEQDDFASSKQLPSVVLQLVFEHVIETLERHGVRDYVLAFG